MTLTLGSFFDGIGGFPLAASRVGVVPVWASEIDPSCVEVTKAHFPAMTHYGNITKIDGRMLEPVDIVAGGSPCQDLSMAGRRAGLSGERSGLFHEMMRIIKEMREASNGRYPRYALWENVPGAFSSNRGYDFKTVVEAFVGTEVPVPELDRKGRIRWRNAGLVQGQGRSFAWRVLDAQYFGVPQRRRRIFAVADFGGGRATEILFEPEGVSGNPVESGKAGQSIARCLTAHSDLKHQEGYDNIVVMSNREVGGNYNKNGVKGSIISKKYSFDLKSKNDHILVVRTSNTTQNGRGVTEDVVYTLNSTNGQAIARCVTAGEGVRNDWETCTIVPVDSPKLAARRLTPVECERLQGFPDNWTALEGISDSSRYRMLGNSVAVPCVQWIMKRIK